MKRSILLILPVLLLFWNPALQAQERKEMQEKEDMVLEQAEAPCFLAMAGEKEKDFEGPPGHGPFGEMGWLEHQPLLEKLKLTEEQLDKIHGIKVKTEKEMIKNGAVMADKMIDLREEMDKETLSESKIKDLINEISKIQTGLFTARMTARLEVAKLLTPEQRKELKKFIFSNKGMKKQPKK